MTEHTEATLTEAIKQTWRSDLAQPRYVVAIQVNNGAGFNYGRTLDAVVFDTWPSKGLALHGLEIKCSKSDLRRELQQPAKFAEFAPYLDTFSIVGPKEVIDRDIIPKRWGIYVPDDNGALRTIRKPLYLHEPGERDRETCDRSFAAGFCRALVQRSLSTDAHKAAEEAGFEAGKASCAHDLRQAAALKEVVEEFEAASGVSLNSYHGGIRIGEAVKFVLGGGLDTRFVYSSDLRDLGTRLLKLADELDALKDGLALERPEVTSE